MALRLLAGPFDIVNDAGAVPSSLVYPAWYPRVGLVARTTVGAESSWAVLALDGVFQSVNDLLLGDTFFCHGWCPDTQSLLQYRGTEYELNAHALMPTQVADGFTMAAPVYGYAKLTDRRIAGFGRRVKACSDKATWIDESDVLPFPIATMGTGRNDGEVSLAYPPAGQFAFYDTHRKVLASPVYSLGLNPQAIVYAPEFGVLVSVHSEPYQLRVWSLSVAPATLSAPVLLSGTTAQGHLKVYRVRALGADADPCAGELVEWVLTGDGTLLDLQSTTDAEGYAIARVLYGSAAAGDATVEASLRC